MASHRSVTPRVCPKTEEQQRSKTAKVATQAAPRRASHCLEAESQLGLDSSRHLSGMPDIGPRYRGPRAKGRGGGGQRGGGSKR